MLRCHLLFDYSVLWNSTKGIDFSNRSVTTHLTRVLSAGSVSRAHHLVVDDNVNAVRTMPSLAYPIVDNGHVDGLQCFRSQPWSLINTKNKIIAKKQYAKRWCSILIIDLINLRDHFYLLAEHPIRQPSRTVPRNRRFFQEDKLAICEAYSAPVDRAWELQRRNYNNQKRQVSVEFYIILWWFKK